MNCIIGSNGFLGKQLVNVIKSIGEEYLTIPNSSSLDLLDRNKFKNFLKGRDITKIFNCAAFVGGIAFGYKYPVGMLDKNMIMTSNIYNALKHYPNIRIINPISNCSYPGNHEEFCEDKYWNGELHDSVKFYGFSRKAVIIYSDAYKEQYNIKSINLCFSNMNGPNDHFDVHRSHALGAIIKKICDAQKDKLNKITIWGDGTPIREWTYVEDAARVMLEYSNYDTEKNLINIGVGKGISIKELANLICEESGYDGSIIYDDSKPNGAKCKIMNVVDNEFNFTELRHGIKKTIEWYKKNNHENNPR